MRVRRYPADPGDVYEALRAAPQEVRQERDRGRPAETAERVPEEERRPRHPVDPGQPRRRDPQAGDPPAQEHRLRPVALEERLADLDHAAAVALERPGDEQELAPVAPPEREPDVVADDRRDGRDDDHEADLQMAARGEDAGREERGLAGDRDPHRLDRDEDEQHRIAHVPGDGQEAGQHHRASTMPRCPRSPAS